MKSKKGFQSDIQSLANLKAASDAAKAAGEPLMSTAHLKPNAYTKACLLYTSDAADDA